MCVCVCFPVVANSPNFTCLSCFLIVCRGYLTPFPAVNYLKPAVQSQNSNGTGVMRRPASSMSLSSEPMAASLVRPARVRKTRPVSDTCQRRRQSTRFFLGQCARLRQHKERASAAASGLDDAIARDVAAAGTAVAAAGGAAQTAASQHGRQRRLGVACDDVSARNNEHASGGHATESGTQTATIEPVRRSSCCGCQRDTSAT